MYLQCNAVPRQCQLRDGRHAVPLTGSLSWVGFAARPHARSATRAEGSAALTREQLTALSAPRAAAGHKWALKHAPRGPCVGWCSLLQGVLPDRFPRVLEAVRLWIGETPSFDQPLLIGQDHSVLQAVLTSFGCLQARAQQAPHTLKGTMADSTTQMFIRNLPWSIRARHLEIDFGEYGEVTDAFVAYEAVDRVGLGSSPWPNQRTQPRPRRPSMARR